MKRSLELPIRCLAFKGSWWADFDFLIMFVYAIHTIAVGFLKFCVFFCCCCCCCFKFTLVRKQTRMKICHLELGFHLFEFSGLCSVFFLTLEHIQCVCKKLLFLWCVGISTISIKNILSIAFSTRLVRRNLIYAESFGSFAIEDWADLTLRTIHCWIICYFASISSTKHLAVITDGISWVR